MHALVADSVLTTMYNTDSVPSGRSIFFEDLSPPPNRITLIVANHTVPSGTVSLFGRIPGNKLPGYDHSVPTGQSPMAPNSKRRLKKCDEQPTSPNNLRACG